MKEFKTVVASVLHGGVYVSCSCFRVWKEGSWSRIPAPLFTRIPPPEILSSLSRIPSVFLSQSCIHAQLLANLTSQVAVKSRIPLAFCRIPQRIVLKFRIPGPRPWCLLLTTDGILHRVGDCFQNIVFDLAKILKDHLFLRPNIRPWSWVYSDLIV